MGGSQQFTITSKTLKSTILGVSSDCLPRAIPDNITVTRKLGMRFLWVGSLCIFQDSTTDKNHEIPTIARYIKTQLSRLLQQTHRKLKTGFWKNNHHWIFAQSLSNSHQMSLGPSTSPIKGKFSLTIYSSVVAGLAKNLS